MRQTVLAAALLLLAAPAAAQNESRHCPREVREHYLSSGKYKGVFDYGASALGGQEQLNLNLALTFHGDLTLIADGGTVLGIEGMATYYLGGTGRNTVTGPSGGPAGTIPVILQESAAGPLTLYEPGDRSFRVAASLKGKGGVAAALPGGLAGGGAFAAGGGHFVVDFRVEQASCDFVWGTFNMLGIENSIAALRAQGFTVKDDRGTWYATAGSGTAKKMAALHGRLRKEPPPGTDRDREATSARLAKLGDEIALEPPLVRDCLMPLFREYVFRVLEEWVRQDIEALKAYRGSLEGLDKLLTQAMTADRSLVLTGLDQCTRQLHVDLWNAAGAAYEDYLARMIKSQAPLRDVLMQMNAIQVLGSVSPELREKTREAVRRFAKRLADTYLKAFTDAYQASGNNLCDPVVQAALLQAVHAEEAYVMIRGGGKGDPPRTNQWTARSAKECAGATTSPAGGR